MSYGSNSATKMTDSGPPSRWFMDSSKMSSARSMQTYQTSKSAAPPARWFMDPPPKPGSSSASTGSGSSVASTSSGSSAAPTGGDSRTPPPVTNDVATTSAVDCINPELEMDTDEQEAEPTQARRPFSRGLSRGNNLIQMSMRHIVRESSSVDEMQEVERPHARRPISRGLSRGNNLIQMSMRQIDTRTLQGILQADRIDEEADLMDSADNLELCNIDLEESSLSSTNSSK